MSQQPSATAARVEQSVNAILDRGAARPEIGIILGSGLGPLADEIEDKVVIPYAELPGFTPSTAPGHAGELHVGTLAGRRVAALKGRLHYYDGHGAAATAFPVRVLNALGADRLFVSNACGGLNPAWNAGELMLQLDFINFQAANPLLGPNVGGERFPVMYDCYDPAYLDIARSRARALDLVLREGIYLAISGPAYSTRAEGRLFRSWGADAVGMSTVFEVMMARQLGMRVLGISCITDMAVPDAGGHTTGDEVVAMAERSGAAFRSLVRACLPDL